MYEGNSYGKIGHKYVELKTTTQEVNKLQNDKLCLMNALKQSIDFIKRCQDWTGEDPNMEYFEKVINQAKNNKK